MFRSSTRLCLLFSGLLIGVMGCGGGSASVVTPTLKLVNLATGLNQPIQYKPVPGQASLAYVVERGGLVKVLVNDSLQSTALLDISGLLSTAGEGGLFGVTFDPNFASNRFIYLHYSTGSDVDTQVSRFTVNSNFLTASAGSVHSVIKVLQAPYTNHKGGSINFGGDGMLYVALGDGGSANDPQNRSQDKTTLLGKMLRIDPSGDDFTTDSDNNYSIPPSNPFISNSTVRGEIWAFGLRNPFRWHFDSVANGFWIADVGQDAYEEVNFVSSTASGRNFGWRVREGKSVTTNSGPTFGTTFSDPFVAFPHPMSESLIGGFVYRGTGIPGLSGQYLAGDYVTNKLWSVPISLSGGEAALVNFSSTVALGVASGLNGVVSIDPDVNGEPVVSELNTGNVSRLVPLS